jgi:ABC-type lipoprotein release transport system permease subunit
MTFARLLLRNLFYHWRGNAAVLLGVAVGTAVLTGALLVGDSLRGSLRDLAKEQLGPVDHALVSGRFFRQQLGSETAGGWAMEMIVLRGGVATVPPEGSNELPHRVGQVTIYGDTGSFASFVMAAEQTNGGVTLTRTLARELGVKEDDEIVLYVQKGSGVPRETLLGRRDAQAVVGQVKVKVGLILPDNFEWPLNLNLNPSPAPPRNVFIRLRALQDALGEKGRINAILTVKLSTEQLQANLRQHLTLDDWGLVVLDPETRFTRLDRNGDGKLSLSEWKGRVPRGLADKADTDNEISREAVLDYYNSRGYLSLESRQMYLEPAAVRAALAAAPEAHLRAAPTLVYLANDISDGEHHVPYSVVAALDPTQSKPLGPFLPKGVKQLADDEIVLTEWEDSPLKDTPIGDKITLTYFAPDAPGTPPRMAEFKLVGRIPLDGAVADDPDLAPEFPGITDKATPGEWEPPSSFKRTDIDDAFRKDKGVHEQYWRKYRTTPKAYVSLAKGRQLWGSRFGDTTSIRLAPEDGRSLKDAAADFRVRLRDQLNPEDGGFVFDPVRERALQASAGGNDFGELFLGFSFFLIVAALLLVGLLFRLNLDRRASEIGLLMATGFRRRTVFLLLLGEGAVLAAVGGIAGSLLAIVYSRLLLDMLRRLWPVGLEQSFLRPYVTTTSLAIGFVSAFVVSLGTIAWAMLALRKVSPRALLAGETTATPEAAAVGGRPRWSVWVALVLAVLGLVLLPVGHFVHDSEERASLFFGSGFVLLIAALTGAWAWMRSTRHATVSGRGDAALAKLGVRNAARHPVRSLLTAGLLAAAAFLLVAVESFRRHADEDFLDKNSGSGGYALVADSDVPIYQDLNSDKGREEMELSLEGLPDKERSQRAEAALKGITFQSFRVHAGDDASCLNLYQPRKPRLLGVPPSLVDEGGFRFADSLAKSADDRANPWRLLDAPLDDGAIPVIGEANTVKWMLKSDIGKDIAVTDERGNPVKLRVVGLLSDSVFQSGLLLSEANFLKLYPSTEGYNFFLIRTPPGQADEAKAALEAALGDRGFEVTPSARRLEAYLAVENMYLSTFQALGGLGLLLGTLGLAVVLLRSVWERRGELALLRALGYRHRALGWLLLSENGFLLLLGLGVGAVTALLAVAPHLLAGGGSVPWPELLGMLAAVLLVGLSVAALALAATLRAPLVPALRRE